MNEKYQEIMDRYMLSALIGILNETDPSEMKILPHLASAAGKYGMPIKNIGPFVLDFLQYVCNTGENTRQSEQDAKNLRDMLSRSGFMTIGFDQEGEKPDGNG